MEGEQKGIFILSTSNPALVIPANFSLRARWRRSKEAKKTPYPCITTHISRLIAFTLLEELIILHKFILNVVLWEYSYLEYIWKALKTAVWLISGHWRSWICFCNAVL